MSKSKRFLSFLLAVVMIASLMPSFVLPAGAAAPEPWTPPTATLDANFNVTDIEVNGTHYAYGMWVDAAHIPDVLQSVVTPDTFNVGSSDLEWVFFQYGTVNFSNLWKTGVMIRPKTGAGSNYAIPNNWTGYTALGENIDVVYLCDGTTGVGSYVFQGRSTISDVYLADSVTSVGSYAFSGCSKMESIDLTHLTTVGSYAFNGCGKLTDLSVATADGAVLQSIGSYAFSGCSNAQSISVGGGASESSRATIGSYAFTNLDKVTTVTLGSNLTLSDRVFYSDSALTTLTVGSNVNFSGAGVFLEDTKLLTATFGSNIQFGKECFRKCYAIKESEGKTYLDLTGVTSIGERAFEDCYTNLRQIAFSDCLTSIGKLAFAECLVLQTVNLQDTSVTEIPQEAFAATALNSVTIPNTVRSIGDYAFSAYMKSPTDYVKDNGINDRTYTGSGKIHNSLATLSFEAGSALTSIGQYAFFFQGLNMTSLTIPDGVQTIGQDAFYHAGSIGDLTLAEDDTISVGYFAFSGSNLTGLTVCATNKLTTSSYAFNDNNIASLDIRTTGTVSLGSYAFYQHRYLPGEISINANSISLGSYCFYVSDGYRTTDRYQTLTKVTLNAPKVTVGEYAFANNKSLSELHMPQMRSAANLSLGSHAFGHDSSDAYYTVSETLHLIDAATGEPMDMDIPSGMRIFLGDMTSTGPLTKFISGTNYFAGADYEVTLLPDYTRYPTCTEAGSYTYQMTISTAGVQNKFYYQTPIEPLGHLYDDSVFSDADCLHGEYYEKTCVRGCVSHDYGVDDDGYAIDQNGQRITEPCTEPDAHIISETGGSGKLGHEYYAGTLYSREKAVTPAEYAELGEDQQSNFFLRYSADGGDSFINHVVYDEMEPDAQADYEPYYVGTEYLTESEYAALSDAEKAEFDGGAAFGRVALGVDGTLTVEGVGTFTSPFDDYDPVYISYECYRDTHSVEQLPEIYPYSVAYIPNNLAGKTDQTLSEIAIGVNNLSWKNPNESLAGPATADGTVRKFTAVYQPDGNGVDVYKPVEIELTVEVSRVELSIEEITFSNTRQSTKASLRDVTGNRVPEGLTLVSTKYFDGGHNETTLAALGSLQATFTGTVELTYTYDNDVYDLAASRSGTDVTYWNDGVYNTAGSDTVTLTGSGYTVTVSRTDTDAPDTVTLVISHAFALATPSLDIVEAVGENVTYDGEGHGFTLSGVPASSTVTVTPWTTADAAGEAAGAALDPVTLSAPDEGMDVYSDLRDVDDFAALVSDAGTYYYKIEIQNSAYASSGGAAYTAYVTVTIDKKAYTLTEAVPFTYDGTPKTAYETTADYTVTGVVYDTQTSIPDYVQTATKAGRYTVQLTLTNTNYKWQGQTDDNLTRTVSWNINRRTVAVPSLDQSKTFMDYNHEYQTPLILDNINTVAEGVEPETGDYKYDVADNKENVTVSVYLNGNWVPAYTLYKAFGRVTGYRTITGASGSGQSGLFDTANFMWPGNAASLSLGSYTIAQAEITRPTLNVPAADYTGSPYTGTPTLEGSFLWVNADGENVFKQDAELSFEYYDGLGRKLEGAPTEVGLYSVKVDLTGVLLDSGYRMTNPVVAGTLQINKASVILKSSDAATCEYSGEKQTLPDPKFLDADGVTEIEKPEGVTLRYYEAVADEVEENEPLTYHIAPNDEGTTDNTVSGDVGEYIYFVEIDSECDSYTSLGQVLTRLTVTPAAQTVAAEKADGEAAPSVTYDADTSTYSVAARLCDEPLVLNFRGEKDKASVLSFVYGENTYNSGTFTTTDGAVTVKMETASGGGTKVTIAFNTLAECESFTVNCAKTDNITDDCSVTVNVAVGKAIPTVSVEANVTGTDSVYTGSSLYTFTTTVTGGSTKSISGTETPVEITTTGSYNNCELYFYTTEDDAAAHNENGTTTEPVSVGTYYVTAKYLGDDNYDVAWSAPAAFSITNAELTVGYNSSVGGTYKGSDYVLADINNVIGVGSRALTLAETAAQKQAAGYYYVEYYPTKDLSLDEIDALADDDPAWTETQPALKDVSDSGSYVFRVVAPNYGVAKAVVTAAITPVDLSLSVTADGLTDAESLSKTKVYDGDDKAVNKAGDKSWTVTAVNAVGSEIPSASVAATYPGGANVASGTNIHVIYTLNTADGFKAENYTVNGENALLGSDANGWRWEETVSGGSVTKKPVTVTGISAASRAYNGTTSVALSGTPVTADKVGSDELTLTLVSGAAGTVGSADCGSYDVSVAASKITLGGAQAGNYSVGAVGASLSGSTLVQPQATISARALTVSYANKQIPYTGSAVTGYRTATAAVTTADASDAASVASDMTAIAANGLVYTFYSDSGCTAGIDVPTAVGTYYVKVTLDTDTYSNYTASAVVKTVEITDATAPTVSFDESKLSWTYDGTAHTLADTVASVTGTTADGSLAGKYSISFFTSEADRGAGTNAVTSVKDVLSSGTYYYKVSTPNYSDAEGSITVTVSPKDLTVTATGLVTEKTYDSTKTAAVTGAEVTGMAAAETVTVTAAAAEYDSAAITAERITVTYTMSFTDGAAASNYTYTAGTTEAAAFSDGKASETVSGTITARGIAVTAGTVAAAERAYDGTATVTLSGAPSTEDTVALAEISGSKLTISLKDGAVGTAADVNAADGIAVSIANDQIELSGSSAGNYTVTGVAGVTVNIKRAAPTFTLPAYQKVGYSGEQVSSDYYYVTVTGADGNELAKDNASTLSYTFWLNEACTTAADGADGSTPPTEHLADDAPYYVKAHYAGDGNHNAADKIFTLVIGEISFDMANSPVEAYTGTYDGTAHPVIDTENTTIMSTMASLGTAGDITSLSAIYVIAKGEETEAPAANADGWTKVFDNGSATDAITLKNAGSYAYWYKLEAGSHETAVGAGPITVTIAPATLNLSSTVTTTKAYDGKTAAVTADAAFGTAQGSDEISVTAVSAYADKTKGTNKTITTTYTLSFTNCEAANYVVKDASDNTLTATGTNEYKTTTTGSITAKQLTVTGVTATGRVYDNTVYVSLGGTPTATVCTDDSSTADDVTFSFVTNPTGTVTDAKPGTYNAAVDPDVIKLTGADKDNYEVTAVTSPSVTIAKKQLTLSYGGKNNTTNTGTGTLSDFDYIGTPLTGYTTAEYTGTVEGGAAAETVTYSFWKDEACTATPAVSTDSSTAPTAVGTYYVKATLADNDYYLGGSVIAKVVITDAELTVTPTAYTGSYDGQTHAPASFAVTAKVGGETASITDYTVTFLKGTADGTAPAADAADWNSNTVSTVKDCDESGAYYYRITYANHTPVTGKVTVTISPIALTLSSTLAATEKVYDGSAAAAITENTVKITAGSEAQTALANTELNISASAAYNDKTAAEGKTITTTYALTVNGEAKLSNYTRGGNALTASETETTSGCSITKKELAVTGAKAVDFTYNADTKVTLDAVNSALTSADVVADDTVSFAYDAAKNNGSAASAASKDAGTRAVTVSDLAVVVLGGADAGNYTVKSVACADVTISRADWTVTWSDKNYAYTGLAVPAATYSASFAGAGTETTPVSVTYYFKGETEANSAYTETVPSAAGVYDMKLVIAEETNYNDKTVTKKLTIGASELTVNLTPYSAVYDGQSHAPAASVSVTGVVGGTPNTAISNYTIKYTKVETGETEAPAADSTRWTTGASETVKNVSESGDYWYRVSAENFADSTGKLTGVSVTPYALHFTTANLPTTKTYDAATDVDVSSVTITADSTANSESVTAALSSAVYDSADASDSRTITVTYAVSFGEGVLAGNYTYDGTGSENEWTVTERADAAITAKTITVTIKDQTHTYNASEPWTGCTQTSDSDSYWTVPAGALEGEDAKADLHVVLTKTAGTAVGTYPISGAGTNGNYAVTFSGSYTGGTQGKFTISAQGLTVKIDDTTGYYGNEPELTAALLTDGNVANPYGTGEDITTIRALFGEDMGKIHLATDATAASGVDTYEIYAVNDAGEKITSGVYGGYSITFVSGEYEVQQRPVTIHVKDATTTYDSAIPTFEYEISSGSAASGDTLSVTLTTTAVHTDTSTSNVGTYPITASAAVSSAGGDDQTANYVFTYTGSYSGGTQGTYTISKADLEFGFVRGAVGAPGGVEYNSNPLWFQVARGGREMSAANGNAFDGTIVYSSEDDEIASVDPDTGVVTPHAEGETTVITATISGSRNYNIPTQNTASYTMSVSGTASILATVDVLNAPEKIDDPTDRTSFEAQELVDVDVTYPSGGSGCTVSYSLDGGLNWSTDVPTKSAAGSYLVKIKVECAGLNPFETEVTAVIRELPTHTVRFNANGGHTETGAITTVKYVKEGFYLLASDVPAFVKSGHTLKDWTEAVSGETKTAAQWLNATPVNGNMVFTANWELDPATSGLTVTVSGTPVYDGTPKTPPLTVKAGQSILSADDYVAEYSDNIHASENASVTVTGKGSYAGFTGSATFTIQKGTQTVTFAEASKTVTYSEGGTVTNLATAALDAANAVITYTVDRTDLAQVDASTGVVTPLSSGTVTVKATAQATDDVFAGEKTYTLTVNQAEPVLRFANSTVSVRLVDGAEENALSTTPGDLTVHYTSSNQEAAKVNADTGAIELIGVGETTITAASEANNCYKSGTASYTLKVLSAAMDVSVFSVSDYRGVYDGNEHSIVVTKDDAATVGFSTSYNGDATVYSAQNPGFKAAGTHTVYYKITAPGYDAATGSAEVVITPAPLTSAAVSGTYTYTGSPVTVPAENLTVMANLLTLEANEYSVQYVGNENAGTATALVSAVSGGNYTGTVLASFAIAQKNIEDTPIQNIADQIYTGSEVKPTVTVTGLTEGRDFTVSYENNVSVGSGAKAVITGIGNYTGTATKTFRIVSDSEVTIRVIVDNTVKTYNGQAQSANILVLDSNGRTLDAADYEVSGNSGTDADTYTITVTGKGGYAGKNASGSFTIEPAPISGKTVTPIAAQAYTGEPIKPTVTVSGLTENTDFTVAYSANVNAGTATVTVTGKGNYTGTKSASFTITPKALTAAAIADIPEQTYAGSAVTPKLTVTDGAKQLYEGTDYTVTFENNSAAGEGTAKVSFIGNYTGSGEKKFSIKASAASLTIASVEPQTYTGDELKPEPEVRYGGTVLTKNVEYTYSYSGNVNAGTAILTVTGLGSYAGVTDSTSFTINPAAISGKTISPIGNQLYTGSEVKPNVTISGLTSGTDFTVAYSNNVNVGEATVTVTGHGNYTGTTTAKFNIVPQGAAITPTVTPETIADQTYTGQQIKPVLTVKANGRVLEEGVDYTLSYGANTAIGTNTGSVTVTYIGNYLGALPVTRTFSIVAAASDFTATPDCDSFTYDGEPKTVNVTVKYGETPLTENTDYTVSGNVATDAGTHTVTVRGLGTYSRFTRFVSYTVLPAALTESMVSINGSYEYSGAAQTASVSVSGLTAGTDYTVLGAEAVDAGEHTVTVIGKGNYTGTVQKTFTVAPKSVETLLVGSQIAPQTFTGSALTPDVPIFFNGKRLAAGADYTLSYRNNTAVGTAEAEVTGIGNFTGSGKVSFLIVANTYTLCVDPISEQTYSGEPIEPQLRVTYAGVELEKSAYDAVYSSNQNVGMASVTVTGKTGTPYAGITGTAAFEIVPLDIASLTVEPIASVEYDGSAKTPAVTVSGLSLGTDYTVFYGSNVNAGSASVTVVGKGNYTGTKTAAFAITAKALDDTAVLDIPEQTWTGSAIEPTLLVKDGAKYLAFSTDYTVRYENNTEVGSGAKAIVSFTGNYTGSAEKTFTIASRTVSSADFSVSASPIVYEWTGSAITPNVSVSEEGTPLTAADFTVTYFAGGETEIPAADVKEIGFYLARVNGAGNYSGTLGYFAFTVVAAAPTVAFAQQTVNKTYGDAPFINTLNVNSLGAVSYQSSNPAAASVDPATGRVTVRGIGTAEITASVAASGNYTAGSASFTVNVSRKNIQTVAVERIGDQTYTGAEIEPEVVIAGLTEGVDYSVSFTDNVSVGTATVTVTGMGGYEGQKTVTFEIVPKALRADAIAAVTYTGTAIEPTLTVRCGSTVLTAGTDYTAAYTDNVAAGTAGVSVTGKGEYEGLSTSASFTINPADIADVTVEAIPAQTYTGSEVKPEPQLRFNGTALVKGTDYTVSYGNNVEKSELAEIRIIAMAGGSFTGARTVYFTIRESGGFIPPVGPTNPKTSIEGAEIRVSDQTYTGKALEPKVTVTLDGVTLVEGEDFTVSYSDNVEPGTAEVLITGIGEYKGSISGSFLIRKSCDGGDGCASHDLTDVKPTDWYHEAVDYVMDHGYMLGVSETEFAPLATATRGMIVTILYRMANEPEVTDAPDFGDVESGAWYEDAVAWAESNEIVTGYDDEHFGPNDEVTREQLAVILFRYAKYCGYDMKPSADLSSFTDAAQISSWAEESIRWANAVDLIKGRTATTIAPKAYTNRAEIATLIMRFCEDLKK